MFQQERRAGARERGHRFRCDSPQFMGHQPAQQAGVVGWMSRRHRLARLLAAIAQGLGDVQAVYGIGGIEVGQGAGDTQGSMPGASSIPTA